MRYSQVLLYQKKCVDGLKTIMKWDKEFKSVAIKHATS